MKTLIIDNYDSFTYNLYQYVGELKGNPIIFRNDQITLDEIEKFHPSHIIISPGPGTPLDPDYFGICKDAILNFGKTIPLLGVCLGHQGIAHAFGGKIVSANQIIHGKTSTIEHTKNGIFKGIPNPIEGMRYHSLMADRETFPTELEITAWTLDDKTIMALKHKTYPIHGIQFHPESIGTPYGKQIVKNFIDL
ncbi:aminodeoxychorismate/anthranilate synthase component II [Candidatus Peregrinibacteria bacterium]|nr:aminodeoxychorismate/anthranilate synthase component II [Candidatus Peregrinibacteria bacterium]